MEPTNNVISFRGFEAVSLTLVVLAALFVGIRLFGSRHTGYRIDDGKDFTCLVSTSLMSRSDLFKGFGFSSRGMILADLPTCPALSIVALCLLVTYHAFSIEIVSCESFGYQQILTSVPRR